MWSEVVCSKNRLFFAILLVGYLFGVILYDFLNFNYTDELLTFSLFLLASALIVVRRDWREALPLLIVVAFFTFYTVYSLLIRSNVPKAIFMDCVIQAKPFLGFYCAYIIAPELSRVQKHMVCLLCVIMAFVLLLIALTDPYHYFFVHPSRYATAVVATFFLLLYCSETGWQEVLILVLILCLGLFSTRAKFYGFFGLAVCLLLYYKLLGKITLNVKTTLFLFLLAGLASWLAKDKIVTYYVDGMMNSREMWSRPAMMLTGARMLHDFFPLGSGLGSFATFASAEYYSPVYSLYGIDHVWGLSRQNPAFICDAFYPALAQFGVVGVVLYIGFWVSVLLKTRKLSPRHQLFAWLVFFFFLIEGVADSTFTHNRGVFVLILLGVSLAHQSDEVEERNI